MKTVTTINLNGRAYQIEESGYALLADYLGKAEAKLTGNPDKDEILSDFEQAIAEKCDRYLSTSRNVISEKEIMIIISEMGPVEGAETEPEKETSKNKEVPKRLYRDPDNRVIAGVASGLAQYFGIDVAIVRIIFIISLFIGGAGVLVYIVLWLAVPEAESSAQKLEMRGDTITLSGMADMMKEKIQELERPVKNGAWQKMLSAGLQLLRTLGQVIQKGILPAIRALIGFVFICAGFVGAIAVTVAVGTALFAAPGAISDLGFIQASAGPVFYIALIAGYFVALIPLLFIFFAGLGIIQKKSHLHSKLGVSFLILWFVAIAVCGIAGVRTAFQVERSIANDASFQETTREVKLDAFTKLTASNGQKISYEKGEEYSVSITGRARDIDMFSIGSENGMLTIEEENGGRRGCFVFCFSRHESHVTITAPKLADVALKNGSSFSGELNSDNVSLSLKNASSAAITVKAKNATFSLENASRANVKGVSDTIRVELKNASHYEGEDLLGEEMYVTARNGSHAELGTTTMLDVTAENGSHIEYSGTPTVEKDLRNGSSLEKR